MALFAGSENGGGLKILRGSSSACNLKAWDKHALLQVSVNHNLRQFPFVSLCLFVCVGVCVFRFDNVHITTNAVRPLVTRTNRCAETGQHPSLAP